jgi:hypothetical protein
VIQGDELKALQRFPGLQAKILATIDSSLDEYRRKSREFVVHLVKMEGALVIPQLFKVAEEQFSQDKRDMGGADAEYGKVCCLLTSLILPTLEASFSMSTICCYDICLLTHPEAQSWA